MKQALTLTFLAALAFTITSCSSTSDSPGGDRVRSTSFKEGVPGGTVVETYQETATVTAIDPPTRKVTLEARDGKKNTVTCGPNVINFDQIRVGDVVKATVTEELTVAMASASEAGSASEASAVALAPKGAKPSAVVAETQQYTAKIKEINLKRRKVTLHFPDGSDRTFVVRQDVDLTHRKVGEEVAFRVAVGVAISVEKP